MNARYPTISKPLYEIGGFKVRQYGRNRYLVYRTEGAYTEVEMDCTDSYYDAVGIALRYAFSAIGIDMIDLERIEATA